MDTGAALAMSSLSSSSSAPQRPLIAPPRSTTLAMLEALVQSLVVVPSPRYARKRYVGGDGLARGPVGLRDSGAGPSPSTPPRPRPFAPQSSPTSSSPLTPLEAAAHGGSRRHRCPLSLSLSLSPAPHQHSQRRPRIAARRRRRSRSLSRHRPSRPLVEPASRSASLRLAGPFLRPSQNRRERERGPRLPHPRQRDRLRSTRMRPALHRAVQPHSAALSLLYLRPHQMLLRLLRLARPARPRRTSPHPQPKLPTQI
jgi:hypothetical protein